MSFCIELDPKIRCIILYQDAQWPTERIAYTLIILKRTVRDWISKLQQGIEIRQRRQGQVLIGNLISKIILFIREIIISPRKELPLGIHDIQISYTQKKSKKRKAETLGDSEEESKQLKMSKLNETVIFELMRTHSNSCRFDCALAALYFLHKEFNGSLKSTAPTKIYQKFKKIEKGIFSEA